MPENFVPCWPGVNNPGMLTWEYKIRTAIRQEHHKVIFTVAPNFIDLPFDAPSKVPDGILMVAIDLTNMYVNGAAISDSDFVNVYIVNRLGHPTQVGYVPPFMLGIFM